MKSTEGSGATRAGDDDYLNEDAYLVEEGLGLYVVCDGLSSAPAGGVAARVAIAELEDFVVGAEDDAEGTIGLGIGARMFAGRAVRHAMDAVLRAARTDPDLAGMSTTLSMLLTRGDLGVVGHVGDSRVYLVRNDEIEQLTVDHEHTEAFGRVETDTRSEVQVDTFSIALQPGDTFLLCTDGAERVIDDPGIVRVAGVLSPRALANRIVSAAQRDDRFQDATAVVVRVREPYEPAWLWLSTVPRPTAFGHAIGTSSSTSG